jgi:Adenylate and Guanylate cyclase catalytic domain
MTPKKLESEAEMVVSAPHPAEPLHDSPAASDRSARRGERVSGSPARKLLVTVVLVLLVLAGLPVAVWLDLRDLSERTLRGQCNVGNFGSDDRMDYTIIGAEANLAARLQSIAQPGEIVLSYETFMLVRDTVRARPLEPITLKGIAHPVVPYAVEGLTGARRGAEVITEHDTGIDLFIDTSAIDTASAERVRRTLEKVAAELRFRSRAPQPN